VIGDKLKDLGKNPVVPRINWTGLIRKRGTRKYGIDKAAVGMIPAACFGIRLPNLLPLPPQSKIEFVINEDLKPEEPNRPRVLQDLLEGCRSGIG